MIQLVNNHQTEKTMAGHRRKKTRRQKRKRKLLLFIAELLVLAVLAGGLFLTSKLNLLDTRALDDSQVEKGDLDEETQVTLSGYTDIALFGLDNRSTGDYDTGNSDVIMIISINNDTKEIRMVSVYRDTYLDVSGEDESTNFRKANSAYALGGVERAVSMLNKNLDLDIDNYVCFDFASVADAVDLVGGVEIEIEDAELEYLNDNIDTTAKVVGRSADYITSAGTYTLDGVQAVAYARIRYTSGGDYKRAERQRIVIEAVFDKVKNSDLTTINSLIDTIFPEIQTDMSTSTILTLASAVLGYEIDGSYGFPFDRTTQTPNSSKGSCVIPCTLYSNVVTLHEILYDDDDYTPSQTVQDYSYQIVLETGLDETDAVDDDFSLEDGTEEADSETEEVTIE